MGGGKARKKCALGVTDSEVMGALLGIMFNGRALRKDVVFKKDVVLPKRSRSQGLRNVYKSTEKV